MVQNVLRDIGGVGIYGVISVCLFFAVFTGVTIWACGLRKKTLDEAKALPLKEDNDEEQL